MSSLLSKEMLHKIQLTPDWVGKMRCSPGVVSDLVSKLNWRKKWSTVILVKAKHKLSEFNQRSQQKHSNEVNKLL